MSVRGDQQVVAADWASHSLQLGAKSAVACVGWNFEGQDRKLLQERIDGFEQFLRSALCAAITQLAATMMLVQTVFSPTLAMRFATLPCGFLIRSETMFVSSM
jgi:hypothetical protein